MNAIKIFPDLPSWTREAAVTFHHIARESLEKRGIFSAALSGGGTPKPVYREIGTSGNQVPLRWSNIHLFWGDERHVPPGHADSNYKMVKAQLLDHISIPSGNVHRVPAEMEARMAAFSYEEVLRGFFDGEQPRFDLVFLGMGDDGHTASLFPHSAGLNEEDRWFIANFSPTKEEWRLTLTKNAINKARNIVVMVRGHSKAKMVADVLTGPINPEEKPIQLISPVDGNMIWILDREAASLLPDGIRF